MKLSTTKLTVLLLLAILGIHASLLRATNQTITVRAEKKDSPQQVEADIEDQFTLPPSATGDKDEIHVTNPNAKWKAAGVYNDPLNDGAILTMAQASGPVKVDVDGREGIGAIYWVQVGLPGGGGGGQSDGLWADVVDMKRAGALVLKDNNTGAAKSDHTDNEYDAPTLYCVGPLSAGTGSVEISLNAENGIYEWEILDSSFGGVFDGTYTATQTGIAPGSYTLVVTSSTDSTFLRVIQFTVIKIGEYQPASYPSEEIPVVEVSENSGFYYDLPAGKLHSITVSAPLDGSEGASNPYEYGSNYSISIDPDNGMATVSLDLPGTYMLQIERMDGGEIVKTYQTLSLFTECVIPACLQASEWPIVIIKSPHYDYNLCYTKPGDTAIENLFKGTRGHDKDKFTKWNGVVASSIESLVVCRLVKWDFKSSELGYRFG